MSATKCYPPVGKHLRMLLSEMSCPIRNLLVSAQLPELAVLLSGGATHSKVGIAFRTLCSKRAFDAMRYAKHIIAAFCGILRRYLDVSRSITVVWA